MSISNADNSLCRSYLADIAEDSFRNVHWEEKELWWFRVVGNTNFYKGKGQSHYYQVFQDILSGCMEPGCCIGFLIQGTMDQGIRIYTGITAGEELEELFLSYRKTYTASLPGVDISEKVSSGEIAVSSSYGGILTGIPGLEDGKEKQSKVSNQADFLLPTDRFCQGMQGTEFSLLILAERQPDSIVRGALQKVDSALTENSPLLGSSKLGEGGWHVSTNNIEAKNYDGNLGTLKSILSEGLRSGMWNVSVCYGCSREADLLRMKSLLLSGYAGHTESKFERLVCIDLEGGLRFEPGRVYMPVKLDGSRYRHLLNQIGSEGFEYYKYMYQTLMGSRNLSYYVSLPQRETPGFYIDEYVEFDTVMRMPESARNVRIGNITVPGRAAGTGLKNVYSVNLIDLDRHVLIVGITGGGKTNTMKVLLSEIWRKNGIPFLVIESAKREYIGLRQVRPLSYGTREFDSLDVFTLGNETVHGVKYRMNPFEVVDGVSLQTHIDYLLSTFNASFEMYAPMPHILERAVYEVYEDKGWDLFSGRNLRDLKEYPTLGQLYYKIDAVINRLGYDTEVQSNVKAALKTRINSLRIGGKGAMLDTSRSIPIEKLLSNPTVLELEDIGDDDTKAFVIGILLVQLYEYRKSRGEAKELQGVLVVEEAHRLLKKVSDGEGSGNRAKAVEFFCNMLAEIRSFGQGIIIADQVPTKLATDTIKNTNLKIVHRTVMEDDRECIGAAMHMTEEQKDYLSSLQRGCAAVFSEGDNRPKLVRMPLIQTDSSQTREEQIARIRQDINRRFAEYYFQPESPCMGCLYCEERKCPESDFMEAVDSFGIGQYADDIAREDDTLFAMMAAVRTFEKRYQNVRLTKPQKICVMGHFLHKLPFKEELQAEILVDYIDKLYPR